jgi:hypothetical protein
MEEERRRGVELGGGELGARETEREWCWRLLGGWRD